MAKWQTRYVQVVVGATPWRFKSSYPHHMYLQSKYSRPSPVLVFFFYFIHVQSPITRAIPTIVRKTCRL